MLKETGVNEIEVGSLGRKIRVTMFPRSSESTQAKTESLTKIEVPVEAEKVEVKEVKVNKEISKEDENLIAIKSPMVGIFYRTPSPGAKPCVEVGQIIAAGQPLCIIEAMKLMNEIESEVAGRVVKILVENEKPVEFGQTLFLVEPL